MKKDRIDFVAIGETVIDLISENFVNSIEEAAFYRRYIGGSPSNIAINLAQLGFSSAIVSRLGMDQFGRLAYQTLNKYEVDTSCIQWDEKRQTTVIFITRSVGTPEVIHYRDADIYLDFSEKAKIVIDQAKIVHFSGFLLSRSPGRETLRQMKEYALRKGKIITFDPCFHQPLWDDAKMGKKSFQDFMQRVDFIKPSLDDLHRLWGKITPFEGIQRYHQLGVRNVVLTLGKDGVLLSDGKQIKAIKANSVMVKDVTGAGDSFWGGFIAGIMSGKSMEKAAQLGVMTSSITLQHLGAIAPLPKFNY